MAGASAYRHGSYPYDARHARHDAYRYPTYGTAAPKPRPEYQPDITVIPGRGPEPTLDPRVRVALRVAAVIALILAVACIARIALDDATVLANMAGEEMTLELNAARAESASLEVQASNLSNPAYVREYAQTKLGMQAPETVETMTLSEDVVAVDGTGALSLAGSLAAVARG